MPPAGAGALRLTVITPVVPLSVALVTAVNEALFDVARFPTTRKLSKRLFPVVEVAPLSVIRILKLGLLFAAVIDVKSTVCKLNVVLFLPAIVVKFVKLVPSVE